MAQSTPPYTAITCYYSSSYNRNESLDTLHGLMIVSMILGHTVMLSYTTVMILDCFIIFMGFSMGWLFFKGGIFYRHKPFDQQVRTGIQRLLVPFAVFQIIGELLYFFTRVLKDYPTLPEALSGYGKEAVTALLIGGSLPGNLPLWFLFTLFAVRAIFSYCKHTGRFYLIALILILAPLDYILDLPLPYYVANISSGLAFFTMGYMMRDVKIKHDLTLWLITGTWLLIAILHPTYIDIRNNIPVTGSYYLWYPTAFIAIIAVTMLANRYSIVIPALAHIGRNAMSYFCQHWIIIMLVGNIFFYHTERGIPFILASLLATFTITPPITYALKHSRLRVLI